jgi:hypothetical protein
VVSIGAACRDCVLEKSRDTGLFDSGQHYLSVYDAGHRFTKPKK